LTGSKNHTGFERPHAITSHRQGPSLGVLEPHAETAGEAARYFVYKCKVDHGGAVHTQERLRIQPLLKFCDRRIDAIIFSLSGARLRAVSACCHSSVAALKS
jgi:hypothetical protein